jgi:hypothetical protein
VINILTRDCFTSVFVPLMYLKEKLEFYADYDDVPFNLIFEV